MIKGIGTDIIEIARIAKLIKKHRNRFLEKVFTPEEMAYCSSFKDCEKHFSGRFAAKEAIVKALGTGLGEKISFKDLSVLNDARGKPYVCCSNLLKERFEEPTLEISISHCRTYAVAVAVWF